MPVRTDLESTCTVEDLVPPSSGAQEIHWVEGRPDLGYVRMKPAVTASEREALMETTSPVNMVIPGEKDEDTISVVTTLVAGRRGAVALAKACWMRHVESYSFPARDGSTMIERDGIRDIPSDEKLADFENLFGRSGALLERFGEFCILCHRLGSRHEKKVEDELGNSATGALPSAEV